MRDRHHPRLCRSCQAPMARQEDACWRCGVTWATEAAPPSHLPATPLQSPTPLRKAA
jgi:predicted amidophosphoribosyltransferase